MLSAEDVAHVVSQWTKIPVDRLNEKEAARLRNLEKILHKRVIGQDEAVEAVCRAVRRGRVGLKEPGRPSVPFCFSAPPVLERQKFPRRWRRQCLAQRMR